MLEISEITGLFYMLILFMGTHISLTCTAAQLAAAAAGPLLPCQHGAASLLSYYICELCNDPTTTPACPSDESSRAQGQPQLPPNMDWSQGHTNDSCHMLEPPYTAVGSAQTVMSSLSEH